MKNIVLLAVVAVLAWYFTSLHEEEITVENSEPTRERPATIKASPKEVKGERAGSGPQKFNGDSKTEKEKETRPTGGQKLTPKVYSETETAPNQVQFRLVDGKAILTEDIVLGTPQSAMKGEFGRTDAPKLNLWDAAIIPFYIQPSVPNPDRILRALAMFQDTAIRFVPLENQKDAIVFEEGTQNCQSYLGKVGGLQPIWLSANCGPTEIAHEVMHALGFVHEQNRYDRDSFIEILWDNIDEKYAHNFQQLPPSLMTVSGTTTFDFRSVMIYSPHTFAKQSSQPTMNSKTTYQIDPMRTLSELDVERIRKTYGP